ncbi:MAG: hypothetical protein JOZ08_23095 [Verrucomicrobia bacterium]|nr:hypothetical protein [Verrucomicrobiota bacterium]MBV8279156.1 hypothetical protein [Verrucomicrobiota bacterium]
MIDAERLNQAVKGNIETLCRHFFFKGKRVCGEWKIADISGAPGNSLGIQLIGLNAGLWHDRATGEGGSFTKLIQLSRGVTFLEAVDLIERFVGFGLRLSEDVARTIGRENGRPLFVGRTNCGQNSYKKVWDWRAALRNGTEGELETLAENRNISTKGVRIAQERGLLRFIDSLEGVAWVITDRCLTQAIWRRLDGKIWKNGAKAKLLPGCSGKRPIGISETEPFPAIAVVEGGPDTLSALGHAYGDSCEGVLGVVCMPSGNADFEEEDLRFLNGKTVRIFPHEDRSGVKCGNRWLSKLASVAGHVDAFDFSGLITTDAHPVKDLNDLAYVDYDCWEENRLVIDSSLNFATQIVTSGGCLVQG